MTRVDPQQAYADALDRVRTAVRLSPAEQRRSQVDQAVGLLAGRLGCRLEQAHAQLAYLAAERGRDLADVAAAVLEALDSADQPRVPGEWSRLPTPADGPAPADGPVPADVGGAPVQHWGGLVQPVLDALPGALALLAPLREGDAGGTGVTDYVIEAASPEAVDVAGRQGAQLVGVRISDAYPTTVGGDLWWAYERVLATGNPQQVGPFTYQETSEGIPAQASYSVRAHRLGDRLLVRWTRHDDDVRHADRISRMERLGNLGWGEWDLLTGQHVWSEQLYRIFERDPADGPMTTEETDALGMAEDLPARAAATEAFVRGETIDGVYRYRINGRIKHLRSVIDAVRDGVGRPLKIYGIVQDVTAREVALRRLAEVEAQLVEQQRSLAAEHQLAARLQQIILPIPEAPIDLPGLRVALRYLPAEQLSHVGGDWYHAAPLPDGTVLLAVGDVAGHGLPAATTMAQLRHALRALAVTTTEPAELLAHLNRLMCDLADTEPASTATAAVARYDPARCSLTWAQAGHPAPLLSQGGRTTPLPRPYGPMLGVTTRSVYQSATVAFGPGDVLLLYTDGLVEHRSHSLDEGLAAVIRTLDDAVAGNPGQPLTALLGQLRRANPDDDTCILAAGPVEPDSRPAGRRGRATRAAATRAPGRGRVETSGGRDG